MSNVFVLDTLCKPLDPVHPGYARLLLTQGKAAVYRRYPFTLILKKEVDQPVTHPLRLKLDPGSKTTGLALVNDASGQVVWAAELEHRGQAIKKALDARRAVRHSRRQRKTRYREPRFDNRRRREGWLPPSLGSRIATIETWVRRLSCLCPIGALSQELVKFDTQAKVSLKDASAVTTTRWALYQRLQATGLPVECGTGGRTKYNRATQGLVKAHWIDAACVGASTPMLVGVDQIVPVLIKATGHGCRQMCLMDRYGFPRTGPKQAKSVKGFQTGDLVRAVVTTGTKQGTYTGRVAVRCSGSFNITTQHGTVQGVSHRFCRPLHCSDGYSYTKGVALPPVA